MSVKYGREIWMRNISVILIVSAALILWFDVPAQIDSALQLGAQSRIRLIILSCFCYGLLMIVPFFPAFELGALIMLSYGANGIILVYITTVISLSVSYFIGRKFSSHKKITTLECRLPNETSKGLILQSNRFIYRVLRHMSKRPYLAIGVLFNLPGNTVLGGGGGIAMMAGASGRLVFKNYLLVVIMATSLFPLALLISIVL